MDRVNIRIEYGTTIVDETVHKGEARSRVHSEIMRAACHFQYMDLIDNEYKELSIKIKRVE